MPPHGFTGKVHELDEDIEMDRYKIHTIEAVVDRVSLDLHELAKRAKDMGSAAQFVVLTMIAISATYSTNSSMRIVGNMQMKDEARVAADVDPVHQHALHDLRVRFDAHLRPEDAPLDPPG